MFAEGCTWKVNIFQKNLTSKGFFGPENTVLATAPTKFAKKPENLSSKSETGKMT